MSMGGVVKSSRPMIAKADRIVIKIGSSSLTKRAGGIDHDRVAAFADVVAHAQSAGRQVVVVSSGAIASGFPELGLKRRPRDLATQQASASVGQGLLLAEYSRRLSAHGHRVGQVLLTADDMIRRAHYRNAQRTLFRLLELGVIPIVNENDTVATDEIRVGDNDRLAALVAHLVDAKALIMLSDVEGLFDGPPADGNTRLIEEVASTDDLANVRIGGVGSAGVGLGGMVSKVEAASIATSAGIPVVLTSAEKAAAAVSGDAVGTFFHARGQRPASRLLWLAHATHGRGQLVLDAGAVEAVGRRRKSLLPAGIVSVSGTFEAGDPVDVLDPDGQVIARGLVNFDSAELPNLLGKSTKELAATLGPAYEREVIHRDDLVVLSSR